jgi:hypothetical protein
MRRRRPDRREQQQRNAEHCDQDARNPEFPRVLIITQKRNGAGGFGSCWTDFKRNSLSRGAAFNNSN